MEHAPLRPVPDRPARPVDQREAAAAVRAALPGLDGPSAQAFALVGLGGRTRAEAALRLQVSEEDLAERLAAARKALRRTVAPLPGSGWCERAERLVSDRLDDALDTRGAARLDVHLRNCPRCALHERRLVQATDALLAAVPAAAPSGPPAPVAEPVPDAAPEPAPEPEPEREPAPQPAPEAEPVQAPAPAPREAPAVPAAEAAAPPQPAAPESPTAIDRARAFGWCALLAVAVLLTVAAVALTVAGVLGAQL